MLELKLLGQSMGNYNLVTLAKLLSSEVVLCMFKAWPLGETPLCAAEGAEAREGGCVPKAGQWL